MSFKDKLVARGEALNAKFAAMTSREKWIIAIGSVFLSGYALFFLLIEPTLKQLELLQAQYRKEAKQLSLVNMQIGDIDSALKSDPNEKIKIEIATLRQSLTKVEADLATVMSDYVAPEKMSRELTSLLTGKSNVRVVGMTVLPPVRIDQNEDDTLPKYYQHSFDLTVVGDYFALMDFVKKVSEINEQFGIQDFQYQVKDYPNAHMKLSLLIISDSENVIRL
jgi:MSHA biogenesis protein MshJ